MAGWRRTAGLALAFVIWLPPIAHARPAADSAMARVASSLRDAMASGTNPSLGLALPALRSGSGEAMVELRFTALTPEVTAHAVALGARIERVSYRYARLVAAVPLAALPDLAALPRLTMIHPLYGAQTSVGSVETQVRAVLDVETVQNRAGVTGDGVRVGLLSDSIINTHPGRLTGEGCTRTLTDSAPQGSGDVPPAMVILDAGPASGRDEGMGMAEIVRDLAPGADILFAAAMPDEATFAENITALRACGADVIADDVLFFAEPMFQDGIIAQAADAAVADGALFFSAATNAGDSGIDQFYRDSDAGDEDAAQPTGVDLHDFGGGRPYAAITLPPRCDVRAVLQWNEPFSGTLGPGASTDLDLYIYSDAPPAGRILSDSTDTQGCSGPGGGPSGDPLEIAYFRNASASTRTVYLAVNHACGDEGVRLRIALSSGTCVLGRDPFVLESPPFGAAAIYGHPAAAGAIAMAAIDHQEIATDGAFTPPLGVLDVEPFSARGGELPFYFDASGAALPNAPVLRVKPDLTAPDGGDTAYFGFDTDSNGFPNFYGTSAAAPAVAAVAALLMQAAPHADADLITDVLRDSARDIGDPGADVAAGAGLVDPVAALELLAPPLAGDCNADRRVTIDELIVGVRIALGDTPVESCAAVDTDGNGAVSIAELIAAVGSAQ